MAVVFYSVWFLVQVFYTHSQVVNTTYGQVEGLTDYVSGRPYQAFLGIPYAKPPTDQYRFKPPEPRDAWQEVRNATAPAPACPQLDHGAQLPIDEDCLYLNVFVSGDVASNGDPLPVMVYIHGGGLTSGSTHLYYGNYLVTMGDPIVLVIIQYRLGLLGFLTLGDNTIPGNLGFKDQVFALEWIQDNIAAFGGDNDRVTIFGGSAGGQSVLLHMVSPMSKGLFHRAIAQSPPQVWRYPSKQAYARIVPDYVQDLCNDYDIEGCLMSADWTELIALRGVQSIITVDGQFLTDDPIKLYRSGRVNDAEFVVGFTTDDGDVFAEIFPVFNDNTLTNGITDPDVMDFLLGGVCLNSIVSDNLAGGELDEITRSGQPLINTDTLMNVIRGKYITGDPIENARGLLDALRDSFFVTFSLWAANQIVTNGGAVHVYSFEHRTEVIPGSEPGQVPLYAPHASEILYMFGFALQYNNYTTDAEKQLSRSMIKAWTSFATHGNPVFLAMDDSEVQWPLLTENGANYVVFDTNMSHDSIHDLDTTWQPITDFWLAVQSFAEFEENDESDESSEKFKSSEEFKSDILRMEEFEADIAVIMLSFICFLLLISTCALGCHVCCKPRNTAYIA